MALHAARHEPGQVDIFVYIVKKVKIFLKIHIVM